MIRGALEYALRINEDPVQIKKNMEKYLAKLGLDRRYKVKWRAVSGNSKHTFSGIFEYCGQKYYFNKMLGKLELEKI